MNEISMTGRVSKLCQQSLTRIADKTERVPMLARVAIHG